MSVIEKTVFDKVENIDGIGVDLFGWHKDIYQLTSGHILETTTLLQSRNLSISFGDRENSASLMGKLTPPQGAVTFVIPHTENCEISTNHLIIGSGQVFSIPGGREFDMRVVGKSDFIVMTISYQLLQKYGLWQPGFAKQNMLFTVNYREFSDLLTLIKSGIQLIGHSIVSQHANLSELGLVSYFLQVLRSSDQLFIDGRNWSESARRILLMEKHVVNSNHSLSSKLLEQKYNMSDRRIREHFKNNFGMSIKRYSQALRLNKARQAILRDPANNIAFHANSFGFTELGRFAGEYKKLFGELPVETKNTIGSE